MGWRRRISARWVRAALVALGALGAAGPAIAQGGVEDAAPPRADDATAREHFVLGRAAYRGADYEEALAHFRKAHELSGRSQLHYNIGISADRLGRHEEALEAFERYLEETDDASREDEVRERIAFLRSAIERAERERQLEEATARDLKVAEPPRSKVPRSAIIGGSALAVVGVAGVTAMAIGLSGDGACLETDSSGACVAERTTSRWTAIYGSIGIAALAGSVAWFTIGSQRAKRERRTTWNLGPGGVVVSGSF